MADIQIKNAGGGFMEEPDLISLIAEKQRAIRRTCQVKWKEVHGIYIADSEWAILELALKNTITISDAAKSIGITRQASHKLVRSMEDKGLVKIYESEVYKNRKYIIPSDLGKECADMQKKMKDSLVDKMEQTIGVQRTRELKEILSMDWGLEYET